MIRRLMLSIFGLACVLSACSAARPQSREPRMPTAEEALAIQKRVTDCEWSAAARYDDGKLPIADVARQVMGICTPERLKAIKAFGFRYDDPQIESDQFEQAVRNVQASRKAR
jgi:hypothetical protein